MVTEIVGRCVDIALGCGRNKGAGPRRPMEQAAVLLREQKRARLDVECLMCCESTSPTTSGNGMVRTLAAVFGMVRTLAAVFGGPRVGFSLSMQTNWRSIVTRRRKKSTRSRVSPQASP